MKSSSENLALALSALRAAAADTSDPVAAEKAALALRVYEGRPSVAGASYRSPHAEQLDRQMGLSNAKSGVRCEGTDLILSAARKGSK